MTRNTHLAGAAVEKYDDVRSFSIACLHERVAERVLRLRRLRQQPDRFPQLRDRVRGSAVLREHTAQKKPRLAVARIRLDDLPRNPRRLLSLTFRQKVPSRVERKLLRKQRRRGKQNR